MNFHYSSLLFPQLLPSPPLSYYSSSQQTIRSVWNSLGDKWQDWARPHILCPRSIQWNNYSFEFVDSNSSSWSKVEDLFRVSRDVMAEIGCYATAILIHSIFVTADDINSYFDSLDARAWHADHQNKWRKKKKEENTIEKEHGDRKRERGEKTRWHQGFSSRIGCDSLHVNKR